MFRRWPKGTVCIRKFHDGTPVTKTIYSRKHGTLRLIMGVPINRHTVWGYYGKPKH